MNSNSNSSNRNRSNSNPSNSDSDIDSDSDRDIDSDTANATMLRKLPHDVQQSVHHILVLCHPLLKQRKQNAATANSTALKFVCRSNYLEYVLGVSVGNPVPDELLQQIGVMLTQSCCDHALMHNSETREL